MPACGSSSIGFLTADGCDIQTSRHGKPQLFLQQPMVSSSHHAFLGLLRQSIVKRHNIERMPPVPAGLQPTESQPEGQLCVATGGVHHCSVHRQRGAGLRYDEKCFHTVDGWEAMAAMVGIYRGIKSFQGVRFSGYVEIRILLRYAAGMRYPGVGALAHPILGDKGSGHHLH